jgi:hypothetical protein
MLTGNAQNCTARRIVASRIVAGSSVIRQSCPLKPSLLRLSRQLPLACQPPSTSYLFRRSSKTMNLRVHDFFGEIIQKKAGKKSDAMLFCIYLRGENIRTNPRQMRFVRLKQETKQFI